MTPPARRGAALLLLLALLSTVLAALALTGAELARSRAWLARENEARQARSLLETARDPIQFWVNQRARRIVLPPYRGLPIVSVLDAAFPGQSASLRIEAADLRALDHAPSGPLGPALPRWLAAAAAALPEPTDEPLPLNLSTASDALLARALASADSSARADLIRSREAGRIPDVPPTESAQWRLVNTSDLWAFRVVATFRRAEVELVHLCAHRAGAWTTIASLVPPPEPTDTTARSSSRP